MDNTRGRERSTPDARLGPSGARPRLDPCLKAGDAGALDRGSRPVLGIPVLCCRSGSFGGGAKVLDDYEHG